MDRFFELTVFVAVAEESGFSAAARRLNVSPPAVTRAVSGLEKRLGIQLLNRTTRHVRMTALGEQYLENARHILSELAAADAAVVGSQSIPVGALSVTAPVFFGKKFVVPGVTDFLNRYPQTEISLALLDRTVNLLDEGFDIGIRIGKLPDSTLRAIPVGQVSWVVCASPDYLSNNGTPVNTNDLTEHPIVSIGDSTSSTRWVFSNSGKTSSVRLKPKLCVNNTEAALNAGKLGYGFVRLLSYQVDDALTDGSLVRIFPNCEQDAMPVNILHRETRAGTALTRRFIDLMVDRLRSEPCLKSQMQYIEQARVL